jgi:hypothetical protein
MKRSEICVTAFGVHLFSRIKNANRRTDIRFLLYVNFIHRMHIK